MTLPRVNTILILATMSVFSQSFSYAGEKSCARYVVEVIEKLAHETLEPGDEVRLATPDGQSRLHEGYFVGRIQDRWHDSLVFLDAQDSLVHSVPTDSVARRGKGALLLSNRSRIVRIPKQIGPTCAANALTNCVLQLSSKGTSSNFQRASVYQAAYDLVSSINLKGGIEQDLNTERFLKEKKLPFLWLTMDEPKAREDLFAHLAEGKPVFFAYSRAKREHGSETLFKSSQSAKEEHAVMIVRAIRTKNGSTKLIVLDSRHGGDPVVWDGNEVFTHPDTRSASVVLIDSSRANENELLDPERLKDYVALTGNVPEKRAMATLLGTLGSSSIRLNVHEFQSFARRTAMKRLPTVVKLHPGWNASFTRFWAGFISEWDEKQISLSIPGLHDETFDFREIQYIYVPR